MRGNDPADEGVAGVTGVVVHGEGLITTGTETETVLDVEV